MNSVSKTIKHCSVEAVVPGTRSYHLQSMSPRLPYMGVTFMHCMENREQAHADPSSDDPGSIAVTFAE
jgi:hypothetical protein